MNLKILPTLILGCFLLFPTILFAQEEQVEKESDFSTGIDVYSSFIWRGSRMGSSPAFQPYVEFSRGGFTLGSWGSFDASGYAETDVYISYEFNFGLSLGATDYYLSDLDYFDYSDTTGSHAFEVSIGYELKGLTLSANYIINEAGGIESAGGDIYFEAGYNFERVRLFVGAGNGWYTTDGEFDICNIGIGTEKEIRITDTFSIPITGQVVFNPELKSLYVTAGISL